MRDYLWWRDLFYGIILGIVISIALSVAMSYRPPPLIEIELPPLYI